MAKKKKIFLSYSRLDLIFVEQLAQDLLDAGYDVWYDLSKIEGGDRWSQEIEDGINQSHIFAIVVTPNSMASEWVEKEYHFASRRGMKIVPLVRELCELPIWLLNIQYIDVVGGNYTRNFHQVLESFENYGRRATDIKPLPISLNKQFTKYAPYLVSVLVLIFLLAALFIPSSPLYVIAPTATNTPSPTPTATKTNTPTPTLTPSPTATLTQTPTVTPSLTPTLEGGESAPILAPEITDAEGIEMVLVDAGVFLMGSDAGSDDERPAHTANLSAFYIDKYEVTNRAYQACVADEGCEELPKNTRYYIQPAFADHAVVFVTWEMADAYCTWRGGRLPTEAEWEKAARGTNSRIYPWGTLFKRSALNYCDAGCEHSWFDPLWNDGYARTAPVGIYEDGISPYGAYDMAGNAAEWVSDWYASDYYSNSIRIDPQGPETGIYRVLRGGSWYNKADDVKTYERGFLRPNVGYNYTGFRCAVSAGE